MANKRKQGASKSSVSKLLFSKDIEAASVLPSSKTISVFDGYKHHYIPNTTENRKKLTERFGKPRVYDYRGKNRRTWLDSRLY